MHTLQALIEAGQYKITGGSEYCWSSFGNNARYLDLGNDDIELSMIFDTNDQTVYQAFLYTEDECWRWTNPKYLNEFLSECIKRNIDPNVFSDNDLTYTDLSLDDLIEKIKEKFETIE